MGSKKNKNLQKLNLGCNCRFFFHGHIFGVILLSTQKQIHEIIPKFLPRYDIKNKINSIIGIIQNPCEVQKSIISCKRIG